MHAPWLSPHWREPGRPRLREKVPGLEARTGSPRYKKVGRGVWSGVQSLLLEHPALNSRMRLWGELWASPPWTPAPRALPFPRPSPRPPAFPRPEAAPPPNWLFRGRPRLPSRTALPSVPGALPEPAGPRAPRSVRWRQPCFAPSKFRHDDGPFGPLGVLGGGGCSGGRCSRKINVSGILNYRCFFFSSS